MIDEYNKITLYMISFFVVMGMPPITRIPALYSNLPLNPRRIISIGYYYLISLKHSNAGTLIIHSENWDNFFIPISFVNSTTGTFSQSICFTAVDISINSKSVSHCSSLAIAPFNPT